MSRYVTSRLGGGRHEFFGCAISLMWFYRQFAFSKVTGTVLCFQRFEGVAAQVVGFPERTSIESICAC